MAKNSTEANFRSIASLVAEERISEMWADPANAINKLESNPPTNIEPILPSGTREVVQLVPGRYRVTVTWQLPDELALRVLDVPHGDLAYQRGCANEIRGQLNPRPHPSGCGHVCDSHQ